MIDRAIEKINAEMQKNASNTYVEIVGHYLIDRCSDDIAAARVMVEGKTLSGAMQAVESTARKAAVKNVAVLTPDTVFDAVDSYFGITRDDDVRERTIMAACASSHMPVTPPVAKRVALDLTDFL